MFWKITVRILWTFSYMNKVLISMTVRFSTWEHSLIFAMANHRTRRNEHILFSLESCPCTTMGHLFTRSVVSNSLWHHELQHTRPPCPSPTPGVHPNSCASSRLCHQAISSCRPLLLLPQISPSIRVNESTLRKGGQSIEVSASASVLPMNTQDWSPLGWTGWISLQSKGLSRVFSNTTVQRHQFFSAQLSSQSNSHFHTWPLEKP